MTATTSSALVIPPARLVTDANLSRGLWALCVMLAALFLVKSGPAAIWGCSALILTVALTLTRREPVRALAVLPCVALIGPIARLPIGAAAGLHLGDVYLGAMLIGFLVQHGISRPVWLGDYRGAVFGALFFTVVCWLFAMDPLTATPTMIGIAETMLVYLMTVNLVRSTADARMVIDGWTFGTTISSVLVLVSYARGEPMLLGIQEIYAANFGNAAYTSTVLFRATFFITGFIFPVAAIIAALLVNVAFPGYRTKSQRLAFLVFLVINLTAIALMAATTVFVAIGAMLTCLVLWLLRDRTSRKAALFLAVIGVIAALLIVAAVQRLLTPDQIRLALEHFSSGESFRLRFGVWWNVIELLLNDAKVLLVGVGPDASVRSGRMPFFFRLFVGSGEQQWAVDNGYLYLLLNYGIFVFLLIVSIIVRTQIALTRRLWRATDPVVLVLWLWLCSLWVMSITQALSVSKPTLLFVQVVAMTVAIQRARSRPSVTRAEGTS